LGIILARTGRQQGLNNRVTILRSENVIEPARGRCDTGRRFDRRGNPRSRILRGPDYVHQSEVLASYEAAGAATFIVQLTGVADDEVDALAGSVRTISNVRSAEAPYSGISSNILFETP
jgi:hypothetical protein